MKRRTHSSAFKAKVALAAIQERESLTELAQRFKLSSAQISKWKSEFLSKSAQVFENVSKKPQSSQNPIQTQDLYAKIGELEMENNFLKKNLKKWGL